MGFEETRATGNRRILNGVCPVEVTLAEAVLCGDPIADGGSDTWVRSATAAAAEQPLLIASVDAPSGAIIKAFPMAVIEVTTTTANKSTLGEQVALKDTTGEYVVANSNLPDVGYSCFVSADEKKAVIMVFPMIPQLTTKRS